MAERGRFELPVRYKPTHAFQACALNHSAISPPKSNRGVFNLKQECPARNAFCLMADSWPRLCRNGLGKKRKRLRAGDRADQFAF